MSVEERLAKALDVIALKLFPQGPPTELSEIIDSFRIPKSKRFIVPTVEEVEEYLVSLDILNPKEQAIKFWNHYNAVDWKRGKVKLVSWKSAVKTWDMPKRKREERYF